MSVYPGCLPGHLAACLSSCCQGGWSFVLSLSLCTHHIATHCQPIDHPHDRPPCISVTTHPQHYRWAKSYFRNKVIVSRWLEFLDVVLKIPFGEVKHTEFSPKRSLSLSLSPSLFLLLPLSLFLCLPPSLSLFAGLVSASATLLSQNIKGSSPTCWPLWSMFCVFVFVCEANMC